MIICLKQHVEIAKKFKRNAAVSKFSSIFLSILLENFFFVSLLEITTWTQFCAFRLTATNKRLSNYRV